MFHNYIVSNCMNTLTASSFIMYINPLTAGVAYIRAFIFVLAH